MNKVLKIMLWFFWKPYDLAEGFIKAKSTELYGDMYVRCYLIYTRNKRVASDYNILTKNCAKNWCVNNLSWDGKYLKNDSCKNN